MANLILGNGQTLITPCTRPKSVPSKAHPYTLTEALSFLKPRASNVVDQFHDLPARACPGGIAVALMTVHPQYLAKSWYPEALFSQSLRAIGSREVCITPRKVTWKRGPRACATAQIFVAGTREAFAAFAGTLGKMSDEDSALARDLLKIEDFEPLTAAGRIHLPENIVRTDLTDLEVVLHTLDPETAKQFIQYAESCGLRKRATPGPTCDGLAFLALAATPDQLQEIAKFSLIRTIHPLPQLAPMPILRSGQQSEATYELPVSAPVDPELDVHVFDGGLAPNSPLDRWTTCRDAMPIGAAEPSLQAHGTAVSSALLFGPLSPGTVAARPYGRLVHWRVLDRESLASGQGPYRELERIARAMEQEKPVFVNISMGPARPVDDTDVDSWTARLDQLFADGKCLATIAVGNSGATSTPRIQPPSDCVNALAVGAAARRSGTCRRARYSCIGPGRTPGIVKPEVVAFGGSDEELFGVQHTVPQPVIVGMQGTSFAAPFALRTAVGIRALFGKALTPLAVKALLVHCCQRDGDRCTEMGWGRVPVDLSQIVTCADHEVRVVYQGKLAAGKYFSAPIPYPDGVLRGNVTIRATVCFSTSTDPLHPVHYTRTGLQTTFRPRADKTATLFEEGRPTDEVSLRSDAMRWETVRNAERRFRASSLDSPTLDLHYIARQAGLDERRPKKVPYALVVTVSAPKVGDLYNRIVNKYRNLLTVMRPRVALPIRVSVSEGR